MTVRNTILCLIIVFISNTCWANNIFIPSSNGFVEKEFPIENKSVNGVSEFFGYNPSQFHSYMDFEKLEGDIITVVFRVFTDSIIYVMTKDNVSELSESKVRSYLENYSFDEEYDSYTIESILDKAIENKAFSVEFMGEIFNRGDIDSNGSFIATKIGYKLFFKNALLSNYQSSDGLNKWAKMLKDRGHIDMYIMAAKKYWRDNQEMILNEVNIQAAAFARVPNVTENEYLDLHRSDDGTINFKMLMVTHYGEEMSLSEFKRVNHGRYELISEYNDEKGNKRTKYKVNQTIHTFDENGKLINSYTVN